MPCSCCTPSVLGLTLHQQNNGDSQKVTGRREDTSDDESERVECGVTLGHLVDAPSRLLNIGGLREVVLVGDLVGLV
jgi:hypothetical protein